MKSVEPGTAQPIARLRFEEAIAEILGRAPHGRRVVERDIEEAAGYVLAEEVRSDLDMPAFDRAAMDGFAFRRADHHGEQTELRITGSVPAGSIPPGGLPGIGAGECVKIMTGAPVPPRADTVIPVEATSGYAEIGFGVRFTEAPPRGANIAPQGQNLRDGQAVLADGRLLEAQEVAVLAAVGRRRVKVYDGPTVAYAATGDELREPGEALEAGCIRNSNAYALRAQLLAARAHPHYLGILRDAPEALRAKLAAGLEQDFLILTGGVSMGEFDLIPGMLEELGVDLAFRKLWVRPGQPMTFGTRARDGATPTMVFGLPGNPISSLFGFDQYALPAVRVFRGHPHPRSPAFEGILTGPVRTRPDFLTLVPCHAQWEAGGFRLTPLETRGSADIFAMTGANAVAMIPEEVAVVETGYAVAFRRLYEP